MEALASAVVVEAESTNATRKPKFRVALSEPLGETPAYFWVSDKIEVMVVKQAERIRVIASICPHMGAQMQFDSKSGCIRCPWHGLTFDEKNLKSAHHRYKKLNEYDGEILNNELLIYDRAPK